jgi:sortase B
MKNIEIIYFNLEWQARWNRDRLAGEAQKVRLGGPDKLGEELELGLFAYDALVVFAAEGLSPAAYAETAQAALASYTGEKVIEAPLKPGDERNGLLLRSGAKQIFIVDPEQEGSFALAALALSEKPKPKKWLTRTAIALLILVAIGCAAYYIDFAVEASTSESVSAEMSKLYHDSAAASSPASPDAPDTTPGPARTDGQAALVKVNEDKVAPLLAVTTDTVAWLQIPGTKIDYAVVQPPDQAFYLTHDIKKNRNSNGNPFLGAESFIGDDGISANVTIYGHNNKNQTMFGTLSKFKDIEFLRTSPLIHFDTLYGDGLYKVVAVYITNANVAQDMGQFFDFMRGSFADAADYTDFVAACRVRSIVSTGVDAQFGDQLLTLVTCTYEFSDARLVVLAREVRAGESAEGYLANVALNPAPLYPQAWYDRFGGLKPAV